MGCEMKIWTVWCDYGATGEGQSVMVWIGYAENEAAACAKFSERFGNVFASVCEAKHGVVRNEFIQYLFSEKVLTACEKAEGKGNIDLYASAHFNFS